jgi:3-deoxy-D-manno-octulosonic-acid transferase
VIIFYELFLLLYVLGIRVTSLWKPKAKAWLKGRSGQWQRLKVGVPPRKAGQQRIWIHCASLGEFEQGRPVIEAARREWPDAVIVLSFFSPSGYEIRRNYDQADYVCYLPMDGNANARRFVDIVDPDVALFVKYEFWHYYLKTLSQRGIPAILVSGAFRSSQPFFRSWGGFFRNILKRFRVLTVQDDGSLKLLHEIGLGEQALISGDTRYDRVLEIANAAAEIPSVATFCEDAEAVVVAGSTWPKDEAALAAVWKLMPPGAKLILAPHELGEGHIRDIEGLFKGVTSVARFSHPDDRTKAANVLIIDNMGMLSSLYRYGTVAFIGGGFNPGGIHNVLEPAVFGLPVVMGPVYQKFTEAVQMVEKGFAFPANDETELHARLLPLLNSDTNAALHSAIAEFVKLNAGATARVMELLRKAL